MLRPSTKRLYVAVLITLILSVPSNAFSQTPQLCKELADKPVTVTGKRVPHGEFIPAPANELRVQAERNARYLRVRFRIENANNCDWYLSVRDYGYRVIQTFSPRSIKNPENQWTVRIPGPVARFELKRCGNAPAVSVEEYIWMPDKEPNSYYSVQRIGHETYFPLYTSTERVVPITVRPWGDFVGFMMSSWGETNWTCSGVLIAPDLFLTNWHCGGLPQFPSDDGYWSTQIVKDTIIDFSWDGDGLSREYLTTGGVFAKKDLDFAILTVKAIDSAEDARPATLSAKPVKGGNPISVIHHPAAMPKHFSACEVVEQLPSTFTHRCDTEYGSSGGPVFDSHGTVVGLHHHGFAVEKVNNKCWPGDNLNKAIRMDMILNRLKTENESLYQKLKVIE